MDSLWVHWPSNKFLYLVHEVTRDKNCLFPMEEHLCQHRYREEVLGLASSDVTGFVDSAMGGLILSEEWMESEVGIKCRDQEERMERELGWYIK